MSDTLNFIATIVVALIGLAGIWIQTRSKERQEGLKKDIEEFKGESLENDKKIEATISDVRMNVTKRYLVTEMTKIAQGDYVPHEEQKRVLKESKDEYNKAGGDSYVDDMYDDLRDRNLI